MNIIKNRYLYFLISLLVIVPGIIFMLLNWKAIGRPIPLGIDFTGGSLLEVQFKGTRPSADQINEIFLGIAPDSAPSIQSLGEDAFAIRSKSIDDATKAKIVEEITKRTGVETTVMTFSSVS